MMNNVEIVAPGGNLEKLKMAVYYGADAVYFGGEMLNLRDKSQNLTIPQLEEAVAFCTQHNVQSIFLLNAYVHENDIAPLTGFIHLIQHIPFSAVMISDPAALQLVQDSTLQSRIHLSTQASTLNHLAVQFWQRQGISRIVLARETTVDDIENIRRFTDIELEIFAHGALCISYSGRCLLSRYLSGRDANQGACSHPCRWNFALVEEKRPGFHLDIIEHERNTTILSSKDLCLIHRLQEYIDAGVNAIKIEGRMKSLYYVANVTRMYCHARDTIMRGDDPRTHATLYTRELDLVSHRPYTDDIFHEFDEMENRSLPYINNAMFLGYITAVTDAQCALIQPFNPIYADETVDIIFPLAEGSVRDVTVTIDSIFNIERNSADTIARPGETARICCSNRLYPHGIIRRRTSKTS